MAQIALEHISKQYGDGFEAVKDLNLDIADGEFMILVGPSGCGKSTALRMVAGLEDITGGELKIGGQVVNDKRAQGSRHRDGVPELRPVPAHDRAREHGLRAQARQDPAGGDRQEGQRRGQDPRSRAAPGPQAGQPLRRPAPAGGDGPRDRAQPERLPDGRAAVEPRRQAPRADADRDLAHPEPLRDDDDLRHPRPDRGADARGPDRRDAGRPPAAGRRAGRPLRPPRQPVRGRVHRLTVDELPSRRRSTATRSSCRSATCSISSSSAGPDAGRVPAADAAA